MEIAAWHVDEDESGGTQDRPGLREAIQRIESSETEGIACWRLNRFARNVAGAIEDVERIQSLGGHLAFVEEDIDPTGPFGSFILTVLLAVATLERDNMVAGWQTAKRHAIERGAKISPAPVSSLFVKQPPRKAIASRVVARAARHRPPPMLLSVYYWFSSGSSPPTPCCCRTS